MIIKYIIFNNYLYQFNLILSVVKHPARHHSFVKVRRECERMKSFQTIFIHRFTGTHFQRTQTTCHIQIFDALIGAIGCILNQLRSQSLRRLFAQQIARSAAVIAFRHVNLKIVAIRDWIVWILVGQKCSHILHEHKRIIVTL